MARASRSPDCGEVGDHAGGDRSVVGEEIGERAVGVRGERTGGTLDAGGGGVVLEAAAAAAGAGGAVVVDGDVADLAAHADDAVPDAARDDDAGADAGAEGEHGHGVDAFVAAGAELPLGECGGVGVAVEDDGKAGEVFEGRSGEGRSPSRGSWGAGRGCRR